MKAEFSKVDQFCLLTLTDDEMRGLYDSIDTRLFNKIPCNVAEHKLWVLLRRIIVNGEQSPDSDAFKFTIADAAKEETDGRGHSD